MNRESNCCDVERIVFFYLPRICNHCAESELRGGLSGGRHLQAGRRRHRAGQPGKVHGLAHVRLGLSV